MFTVDPSAFEYQERVVAFVDVLGFAELVNASEADSAARAKVVKLINTDALFGRFTSKVLPNLTGYAGFFSDSFVLSMNRDRVLYLARETGYLCRHLLLLGFPCRGAIATGPLYHRERVIVGPAFVRAYQMERSVAVYPRIILDDATMVHWRHEFRLDEFGQGPAHPQLDALVKRDRDGQQFLDIFSPLWSSNFIPWTDLIPSNDMVPEQAADFLDAARNVIRDGLAAHRGNAKVRQKYEWLAMEAEMHCRDAL